jgi:hypothetical protein
VADQVSPQGAIVIRRIVDERQVKLLRKRAQLAATEAEQWSNKREPLGNDPGQSGCPCPSQQIPYNGFDCVIGLVTSDDPSIAGRSCERGKTHLAGGSFRRRPRNRGHLLDIEG